MNKKRILLIYPKMGMPGSLVQHMPLSLLYASIDSIKDGFEIDIVDVRLKPDLWEVDIASKIDNDTVLIGISVMTGAPIRNALDISRWLKTEHPSIPVVWGGPHATFHGEEILAEKSVDYVISGYGSKPLCQLARHIAYSDLPPASINGLIFRSKDGIISVPPVNRFEYVDYREIPYFLVEKDLHRYGQLDIKEVMFSMYSAMGCPYKCSFCSSPAQYRNIAKKYVTMPATEVVNHIEYVHRKYGATYIYFIDDDSFVKISHVESIIDELKKRDINVKLGFRGARINEIKKMSDEFLSKLASVGTNIMHIGAESGSQKILDLIRKDCTVQDIVEINQKMARHQEIKTAYNWIVGLPGETIDDLKKTQYLMRRLVKDNPSAVIFMPNKFKPLPGTELYEIALRYGYTKPGSLEEWIDMEMESDYRPPWYSKELVNNINMMQITSFFIDDKLFKLELGDTMRFKLLRILAYLYSPIAHIRLRHGLCYALLEYKMFKWYTSTFRK